LRHRDEQWARDNFTERYQVPCCGAPELVEQQVIGSVWGANGYTTRAQADALAARLGLAPGVRLLDLGAGRGWPGLYLAERSGCSVVLADLPYDGLLTAVATARDRGLGAQASAIVASARHLPFRGASFDAVVHADVLCCLAAKLTVLTATRRILCRGGRTAFFWIYVPRGLPARERRWANAAAPKYAWSRSDVTQLMHSAGFVDVEALDCTAEFAETMQAWHDRSEEHADELIALISRDAFEERQSDRRAALAAIEAGVQRRELVVGKTRQ
jgi:cyclopropane fatty-acyl-phospholipid synthase-like methyltransferase